MQKIAVECTKSVFVNLLYVKDVEHCLHTILSSSLQTLCQDFVRNVRKTKGGNLTPRTVYMTRTLFDILSNRYERRDINKPWVFWHRYWDKKEKRIVEGPYKQRKRLMKSLCEKAGVEHIGFHALRHSGASIMEDANIPLGEI